MIVNTIKAICDLYNEDFMYYDNYNYIDWTEIETWNFTELKLASTEYIDTYFNQPRFFEKLEYIDNAQEIIEFLSEKYEIIVVSIGNRPNLRLKELWLEVNIPYVKFIGVDLAQFEDKSHINMSGGILIDDSYKNLKTSNADLKICFGDVYEWNNKGIGKIDWCFNWYDIKRKLLDGGDV